jgi:hypothetical protein
VCCASSVISHRRVRCHSLQALEHSLDDAEHKQLRLDSLVIGEWRLAVVRSNILHSALAPVIAAGSEERVVRAAVSGCVCFVCWLWNNPRQHSLARFFQVFPGTAFGSLGTPCLMISLPLQ